MKMRASATTELSDLVGELIDEIGRDWIARQLAQSTPSRPLPLVAELWEQARRQEVGTHPSQQFQRLAQLALAVQTLRTTGLRVEDRIRRLRSDFYASCHELLTASRYVTEGRDVQFVPEQSHQRTPEMTLDGEIEVECMARDRVSKLARKRLDTYKLLQSRAERYIKTTADGAGLHIEVGYHAEPTHDMIKSILLVANHVLNTHESKDGVFENYSFRILPLDPAELDQAELSVPKPAEIGTSCIQMTGSFEQLVSGGTKLRNPVFIWQQCLLPDERVPGILGRLNSARTQLSGKLPAIIELEVSAVLPGLTEGELGRLGELVAELFRNSPKATAIRFVWEHWEQNIANGAEQSSLCTRRKTSCNPHAKHPHPLVR